MKDFEQHNGAQMDKIIGPSGVPAAYMMRKEATVTLLPQLLKDQSYCKEYPSVCQM